MRNQKEIKKEVLINWEMWKREELLKEGVIAEELEKRSIPSEATKKAINLAIKKTILQQSKEFEEMIEKIEKKSYYGLKGNQAKEEILEELIQKLKGAEKKS